MVKIFKRIKNQSLEIINALLLGCTIGVSITNHFFSVFEYSSLSRIIAILLPSFVFSLLFYFYIFYYIYQRYKEKKLFLDYKYRELFLVIFISQFFASIGGQMLSITFGSIKFIFMAIALNKTE